MNAIAAILALSVLVPSGEEQQTFGDLQVVVKGFIAQTDGGEQELVGGSTGPIVIGQTRNVAISMNACGNLTVSSGVRIIDNPVNVWNVEVTPLRVQGRAVTSRVQWKRALSGGKDAQTPGGLAELTLRPGESMPLDLVAMTPPEVKPSGRACEARAVSIRVAVDNHPIDQDETGLIVTDLWLVERLEDGTERSQPLSVRGLPFRTTPFYFDRIQDSGVSLDFHGELTASPQAGGISVTLETLSRVTQGGQSTIIRRDGAMMTARKVDASVVVKPDEVVAVNLPRLGENESGAFANRFYSIRIRTRKVR